MKNTLLATTMMSMFFLLQPVYAIAEYNDVEADSEQVIMLEQKQDRTITIKVNHESEKHVFNFNQQQLKDANYIDKTLSVLPPKTKLHLTKMLKRMSTKHHNKTIAQRTLSETQKDKLTSKLAKLQAMLDRKLAKIEKNSAEMEQRAHKIEVRVAQHLESLDELKEVALEFDEIEIESMEDVDVGVLEDIQIEIMTDGVKDIVQEIASLELHKLDWNDDRIIVIDSNDIEQDKVEHLVELLKTEQFTEQEKQKLKEALN